MNLRSTRHTIGRRALSLLLSFVMASSMVLPAMGMTIAVVTTENSYTVGELTDGDGTYRIRLAYGEDAMIPQNAVLETYEVFDDNYLRTVEEQLTGRRVEFSRFFEINLLDGDGETIQPSAPISVVIEAGDAPDDAELSVFHFDDSSLQGEDVSTHFEEQEISVEDLQPLKHGIRTLQNIEDMLLDDVSDDEIIGTPELVEAQKNGNEIVFVANSFSIYGIIYTIDLKYAIEGKEFDFSLSGGSAISFSQLLPALGLSDITSANVENVQFSNPDLIWVGLTENEITLGDLIKSNSLEVEYSAELGEDAIEALNASLLPADEWTLISLKPFLTEETLTVFMDDGEKFTILVTDDQIKKTVMTAAGETYEITVTYGDDAQIPEGADLQVREIETGSDEFLEYVSSAAAVLNRTNALTIIYARFFDISVVKDNEKIEPQAPVNVKITYVDGVEKGEDDILSVIHFAESGTEVINELTLNGASITYLQDSFSVSGTVIEGNPSSGNDYMVLVKYEGNYYIVLNNGYLQKVDNPDINTTIAGDQVGVDTPMLWKYRGNVLYHEAEAVAFNQRQVASDYYWRYIDPRSNTGLSMDNENNTTRRNLPLDYYTNWGGVEVTSRDLQTEARITYSDNHIVSSSDPTAVLKVIEESGKLKLAGGNVEGDPAEVYLATVTDTSLHIGAKYHAVDHIDISVQGNAAINAPLAYGTYYYMEGGELKTLLVSRENPVTLHLSNNNVQITKEDIKNGKIAAYKKNQDGSVTEVPDAFVIMGYSGNAEADSGAGHSTEQVRIDGTFKVADLPTVTNGNGNDDPAIRDARLNNRIYYSVSTTKLVEFDLKYNGNLLYASKEDARNNNTDNKLTANASITMGNSFDYWDPRNECPGIWMVDVTYEQDPLFPWIQNVVSRGDHWKSGYIYCSEIRDMNEGNSGMDFALGTASGGESGILAVEITKLIVDKNGMPISPDREVENLFHIYQKNIDYKSYPNPIDEVKDLDVDKYDVKATQPDYYTGYKKQLDKTVVVGEGGIGLIYDYDVNPGMVYIEEDKENLPGTITDENGQKWNYKSTHFETEYVWRDDGIENRYHVSKEYNLKGTDRYLSIPEVLGNYKDDNGIDRYNGFLEFYVYNVYEPEPTDIVVRKEWKYQNGKTAQPIEDAEVAITLGRYMLVEDPDNPVTGDLVINQTIDGVNAGFSATYRIRQEDTIVRVANYDPAIGGAQITGLPGGDYTVEISSSYAGYEVEDTPTSSQVTIVNGHTIAKGNPAQVGFVSTVREISTPIKTVTVRVHNSINGSTDYQDMTYTFPGGSRIVVNISRPGPAQTGFDVSITVNSAQYVYRAPDGSGYATVNQDLYFDLPTEGTYDISIYHAWGPQDLWVNSVSLLANTTNASNSLHTNKALNMAKRLMNNSSRSVGGTLNSPVPGMKYVVDDTWSTEDIVLSGTTWEKVLENLPSVDNNGNKYLYFISSVTEEGVPDGTVMTFELEEGVVQTTSGERPLKVINTIDDKYMPGNEEYHKRIDALRDGKANPDSPHTGEDLTDLYRLYLDFKMKKEEQEGVDMLFIIDHSGSMNNDAYQGNSNRAPIVMGMLNGSDGFISEFLEADSKNKWAAVGFKGDTGAAYVINPWYRASNAGVNDSEVLSPWNGHDYIWQSTASNISLPNEGETRLTDYTAGFWRAEKFLMQEDVLNDGNKKVIVFISDGIPTLYIPCSGTLVNADRTTGSGYYPDGDGGCPDETMEQFGYFVNDLKAYGYEFGNNIDLMTVGFGNQVYTDHGTTAAKKLLLDMLQTVYGADNTDNFIEAPDSNVISTGARDLKAKLDKLIEKDDTITSLTLSDKLSKYVTLYGLNDDGTIPEDVQNALITAVVKLTMQGEDDQVVTLYENGTITEAGRDIVDSVSYDPATKTISAKIKKGSPEVVYTLSFDVKATEKAYDEYAESGYNAKGNTDTDFLGTDPANATSSRKDGFKSNDTATVKYTYDGTTKEKTYPDPVIQVFLAPIEIVKTTQGGSPLEGAKFNLYDSNYDQTKSLQQNEANLIEGYERLTSTVDPENPQGPAVIKTTKLKHGTYYLVETEAPDGYNMLTEPIKIEVTLNTSDVLNISATYKGEIIDPTKLIVHEEDGVKDWTLKVVNNEGIELPSTGGSTIIPHIILGTILTTTATIGALYEMKKRKKEE